MLEIDTPYGKLQIIGTKNGFATRLTNNEPGQPDELYIDGQAISFYKGGSRWSIKKRVSATAPKDWQPNELLDPML
jgi:hypothetical protein